MVSRDEALHISGGEGLIPKGAESVARNGEQAGVTGVQSPGCGVEMEEVRQVLGGPGHGGTCK